MITCDKCKNEIGPMECLMVFGIRKQDVTKELESNILEYECHNCDPEPGRVTFRCKKPLEFVQVIVEVGTGEVST